MEVECPKHLGAYTIGSQLLGETAAMAGKSGQPNHEPPRQREEGHPSHWSNIYSGNKGGKGGATQKLRSKAERCYNEHMRDPCAYGQCKTPDWKVLPTLAQSMHWRRCMNECSKNARECRLLMDVLVQVPHKTPLGIREHWYRRMLWCMCITILWTLKGTQTLFVVNSVKLHYFVKT